jgi:hypothetical protein
MVPHGTSGSSFLRTCVWGGCAKIFCSFSSDVLGELVEPGAAGEPELAPPAVAYPHLLTAGERAQSMRRSPRHVQTVYVAAVPNADRRGSGPIAFGR